MQSAQAPAAGIAAIGRDSPAGDIAGDSGPKVAGSASGSARRSSKSSWLGAFVASSSPWAASSGEASGSASAVQKEQKEHCLVIPTYGYLSESGTWSVQVRGWVYTVKDNSLRKRVIKSFTKRVFRSTISADPNTSLQTLDMRLNMYLTRTAECNVAVSIVGPLDASGEDPHPYEVRRDDGSQRQAQADSLIEEGNIAEPVTLTLSARAEPPPLPPRATEAVLKASTAGALTINGDAEDDEELGTSPRPDDESLLDDLLAEEDDDDSLDEANDGRDRNTTEDSSRYETRTRSDANGSFSSLICIPSDAVTEWRSSPEVNNSHGHVHLKVEVPRDTYSAFGTAELLDSEGISLISDVDDTIKRSDIVKGASAVLANALLQDTKDTPGMAEAYQRLWKAGVSVHYVSAAPWQVFPTVVDLLRRYGFPPGSFHMRTIFFSDSSFRNAFQPSNQGKLESIEKIFRQFPRRKFILAGDSGEDDMFLYSFFKKRYPDQVLAIFIRDVQGVLGTDEGKIRLSAEALERLTGPSESGAVAKEDGSSASLERREGQSEALASLPRLKIDPTIDPVTMMEKRLKFAFGGFDPRGWALFTDGREILSNAIIQDLLK
ncbi:hypothetical protein DFJ74DRAFT_650687 [Hyaloraphidium curvatum]|nr:hypothetical protein DFJ74DRAFT_650687 [Hyaloraphidium curvatum]